MLGLSCEAGSGYPPTRIKTRQFQGWAAPRHPPPYPGPKYADSLRSDNVTRDVWSLHRWSVRALSGAVCVQPHACS